MTDVGLFVVDQNGKNEDKDAKNKDKDGRKKKRGANRDLEENKDENSSEGKPKTDEPIDWLSQGWARNYRKLSEQEKLSMFVDEIFAYYLFCVSLKVNDTFYRTVLAFVIFFRECLNEIGWKKRRESDLETKQEDFEVLEKNEFCLVNSAEHAPEICNEFVTIYMEKNKSKFDIIKCEQIDLTINLCHWLFEN